MKKLLYVIAVALCMVACESNTPNGGSITKGDYEDLGLTSGTKWKVVNELNPQDQGNGFYTYDGGIDAFGKNIPTKEQWTELVNECTWIWTGMGYKVLGPNGKSITLPASGYRGVDGNVYYVNTVGYYWSSMSDGAENAWGLYFNSGKVHLGNNNRRFGLSVRLVK